jgi:hypothetical protein
VFLKQAAFNYFIPYEEIENEKDDSVQYEARL